MLRRLLDGGGRDEIDLGGNTIDESGNSENISAFRVGKFDDGDEVNYSPQEYLQHSIYLNTLVF